VYSAETITIYSRVVKVGKTPALKQLLLLSIPIIVYLILYLFSVKIQIKSKIDNTKTVLAFIIFNTIVIYAKKYIFREQEQEKKNTKLTSLYRLACKLSNRKSIIRFAVISICIVTFFSSFA